MSSSYLASSSFDAVRRFRRFCCLAALISFGLLISDLCFGQQHSANQEKSDSSKPKASQQQGESKKTDAVKKKKTGFYSPLRRKKQNKLPVENPKEDPRVFLDPKGERPDVPMDLKKLDDLPIELMQKEEPRGVIPPEMKKAPKNAAANVGDKPVENGKRLDPNVAPVLLADSPEAKAAFNELPRSARTHLENVVFPALQSGDYGGFVAGMEALVSKQKPETVESIDQYCLQIGLGTLQRHLADTFARSVEMGMSVDRKMSPAFVEYLASGVVDAVNRELEELADHPMMQNPLALPDDWRDSEQLFWEVHVWKNRFNNLGQIIQMANLIQQPLLDRATRSNDQEAVNRMQQRIFQFLDVKMQFKELREREAELRIRELAKAEEVLRLRPDFESELNAAFVLEMHGGALKQFFTENPPEKNQRVRLSDPGVLTECAELLASGRKHGKDVIEKAILLRTGAHWWLRGRYGVASMACGLLKPPAAMKNPALMFGLFMPKDRPQAIGFIDSETGTESTGYARRHYYTWAVERRDVGRERGSRGFGEAETTTKVTGTDATHFW